MGDGSYLEIHLLFLGTCTAGRSESKSALSWRSLGLLIDQEKPISNTCGTLETSHEKWAFPRKHLSLAGVDVCLCHFCSNELKIF